MHLVCNPPSHLNFYHPQHRSSNSSSSMLAHRRVTLPFDSPPPSPFQDVALPTTSSSLTGGRDQYAAFVATRSRVIRLFNLPPNPSQALSDFFVVGLTPTPISMWCLREEYAGPRVGDEDSVWCVFKSHEEAKAYIRLSAPGNISTATALERDLEPFSKLRRFELAPKLQQPLKPAPAPASVPYLSLPLRSAISSPDLRSNRTIIRGYELSSNPPDKSYSFRAGDWVCGESTDGCGAHNFGKNQSCIGCSAPRPSFLPVSTTTTTTPSSTQQQQQHHQMMNSVTSVLAGSPRFGSQQQQQQQQYHHQSLPSSPITPLPPVQANHILTPSGHALAISGRVRNVGAGIGTVPCVMWWPDNEPLPSPAQVRPVFCGSQPPIMNTGNRGPIEHQPGDWICGKCHYLNWRRRKVCATCYPYAEGNLDGVSPAVLAERIALLRSVLVREISGSGGGYPQQQPVVGERDGWQSVDNSPTPGGAGSRPSTSGMVAAAGGPTSPSWSQQFLPSAMRQRHHSTPQALEMGFSSPSTTSTGTHSTSSSSDLSFWSHSRYGGGGNNSNNNGPLLPSFLREDEFHSHQHPQQQQQQQQQQQELYSPFSSPHMIPSSPDKLDKFRFSPWGGAGESGGNKAVGEQWKDLDLDLSSLTITGRRA